MSSLLVITVTSAERSHRLSFAATLVPAATPPTIRYLMAFLSSVVASHNALGPWYAERCRLVLGFATAVPETSCPVG